MILSHLKVSLAELWIQQVTRDISHRMEHSVSLYDDTKWEIDTIDQLVARYLPFENTVGQ